MILHILWLILKFIGMALLVILGIMVLLICVVLLTPVRYRAAIACKGTIDSLKGEIKAVWLCHLISVKVDMDGKDVRIFARAAWKKLYDSAKEKADAEDDREAGRLLSREKEAEVQKTEIPKVDTKPQQVLSQEEREQRQKAPMPENATQLSKTLAEQDTAEMPGLSEFSEKQKKSFRPFAFFKKIGNAIAGIWEKIKYTFDRICANIEILSEKKDKVFDFLNDEVHQGAFKKTMSELKRLLSVLWPGKITGNVRFGFDDPYLTGKTLAVLGILYPCWAKKLSVTPEFEKKVLEGDIFIKGKIRAGSFVRVGIALLLNKQVRRTIRDIRKFKL